MNRKVLTVFVATMVAAMLATPLVGTGIAGMGQEKLSITFVVGEYEAGTNIYEKIWNSPKKYEGIGATRIGHIRDGDWGSGHTGFSIVVDYGGDDEVTFDNEDIIYSCFYDADFRNVNFGQQAAPYVIMHIRVTETWEIDNEDFEGYIEITTTEVVFDYLSFYEGINTKGSFVGHGVVNDQNIKLSGDSGVDSGGIFREGLVMGWPT